MSDPRGIKTIMKTKKPNEETAKIDNDLEESVREIENSDEEIDTVKNKEDAQLQRLAATIRKILVARRARCPLVPEVPCRDDETAEDADGEEHQVEWMMRLML
jgi:hypothetical protein